MAGVAAGTRGFFEQLASFEDKRTVGAVVWPFALTAAWAFDFLFWGKAPGISFPIYVIVVLACLMAVARSAAVSMAGPAIWLILPVMFFAVAPAVRAEPLTMVLNYLVVLVLLGILTDALVTGGWIRYRLADYIVAFAHLLLAGVLGGGLLLADERARKTARAKPAGRYKPIFRGVTFALPIILVFALLFASADPIFSRFITRPFVDLDADSLSEISFRILYVMVLAYVLAGLFLHAVRPAGRVMEESRERDRLDIRMLGPVEASVILVSLNVLFAFFVVVQFRYFFAGSKAISHLGTTYSEYARRGFAELVVVALLTLLLILGLSFIVRLQSRGQTTLYSSLTSGIVLLTSIILISAFQRLLLYEDAYGFTRPRTYSHVFMVWLALVLIAVLLLQWRNALHFLALLALFATLGFVLSLNLLGVDSFIASRNVDRAVKGAELDVGYLDRLSSDAVPILVARVKDLPIEGRESLSNMLVCKAVETGSQERPWQSIHISYERAKRQLAGYYRQLSRDGTKPECRAIAAGVIPGPPPPPP